MIEHMVARIKEGATHESGCDGKCRATDSEDFAISTRIIPNTLR
jgi:hypothetical protein